MVEGRAPADRAEDYVGAGFTGVKGHKPPGFFSDQQSTECVSETR